MLQRSLTAQRDRGHELGRDLESGRTFSEKEEKDGEWVRTQGIEETQWRHRMRIVVEDNLYEH